MSPERKPLKVIHVINTLETGGAESLMSHLLPILQKGGIDTELICLTERVQDSFHDELRKQGITIHFLSKNRSVYSPLHLLALYRQIKRSAPDIIHAHLFPSFYWVAACNILFGIKPILVFTEHSASNKRMKSGRWKIPDRWVYRQFKRVVCISEGVQAAIKQYMPFVETETIHNGIPLEKYAVPYTGSVSPNLRQVVEKIRTHPRHRVVLSIGRLVWQKNQLAMINALAELPGHVYLLLAGEGDQRELLEQRIAELKLTHRAILLGNQSDIAYLIQQADVGLLTSVSEGFGLAAVEMMAGGLPVVISSVPGLNEVAADPSLVCDPNDHEGFARVLNKLIGDETYYSAMQQKSRQKAAAFSIQVMAEKYQSLYRRLLLP